MKGDTCQQKGVGSHCASTPMIGCPNATNITLHNTTWSRLGRYRLGGAVGFDGTYSYATLPHQPCGGVRACGNCHIDATGGCMYKNLSMLNFTYNHFYPNISSEFTFQAVVHPLSTKQTVGSWPQVIMNKPGEWSLQIAQNGRLEWHVHLASGWVIARGTTDLRKANDQTANQTYVVKATHAGGIVKLFTCVVGPNFECDMIQPEGSARGALPLVTGTADVTFGAKATPAAGAEVTNGFHGALEELQFNRISYENVTAFLFSEPGSGCANYYVWDYTNAAARAHWASSVADIYSTVPTPHNPSKSIIQTLQFTCCVPCF
jgi:hypothetical protein